MPGAVFQQAADVDSRYMALHGVSIDERGMAGDHPLRHAVVELEAHEESSEHVLAGRGEAVLAQMLHPGEAAAAGPADVDRCCFRGILSRESKRKDERKSGSQSGNDQILSLVVSSARATNRAASRALASSSLSSAAVSCISASAALARRPSKSGSVG